MCAAPASHDRRPPLAHDDSASAPGPKRLRSAAVDADAPAASAEPDPKHDSEDEEVRMLCYGLVYLLASWQWFEKPNRSPCTFTFVPPP
jgi:hypothetical protein